MKGARLIHSEFFVPRSEFLCFLRAVQEDNARGRMITREQLLSRLDYRFAAIRNGIPHITAWCGRKIQTIRQPAALRCDTRPRKNEIPQRAHAPPHIKAQKANPHVKPAALRREPPPRKNGMPSTASR